MNKGWYGEKNRHRLASKGIKTARGNKAIMVFYDITKSDIEIILNQLNLTFGKAFGVGYFRFGDDLNMNHSPPSLITQMYKKLETSFGSESARLMLKTAIINRFDTEKARVILSEIEGQYLLED